MSATAKNPRRGVLARVHIAKKEMALDDAAYRDVLKRVVGQDSAADCTDGQLTLVLDEFRRLGWKPNTGKPKHANPHVRMAYAIWKDIKQLLDGKAGDAELRAFVKRQTGRDAIEFCSEQADLVAVVEGLKGWRAGLRRKGAQ
jgi:phage gp16-like protein